MSNFGRRSGAGYHSSLNAEGSACELCPCDSDVAVFVGHESCFSDIVVEDGVESASVGGCLGPIDVGVEEVERTQSEDERFNVSHDVLDVVGYISPLEYERRQLALAARPTTWPGYVVNRRGRSRGRVHGQIVTGLECGRRRS